MHLAKFAFCFKLILNQIMLICPTYSYLVGCLCEEGGVGHAPSPLRMCVLRVLL